VVEVRSSIAVAAGEAVPIPTAPVVVARFVPDVEDNVVNAPVFGVPDPIVPGAAQVPPIKDEALIVPVEV